MRRASLRRTPRGRQRGLAFGPLLALVACGAPEPPPRSESGAPPDLVLVLIDTLRSDRLSCYGYPLPTSPRLDRLAEEGLLFTDVTSQATWTLPSMVTILHGRYLTEYRDSLAPSLATLPELFRDAGYRTIGLIGNKGVSAVGGFDRGFDVFESASMNIAGLESRLWEHLEGIDARAPGRAPLLLYLHPMDPHMPYLPHPELDAEVPPTGAPPAMPRDWQRELFSALGPAGPEPDPDWARRWEHINAARGRYDQGVRHTDDGLARILAELERRGFLEHAVVAVMADHGEVLWERITPLEPEKIAELPPDEFFYREHGAHMTQETVGTPLILWGAGVPSGVRYSGAVENIDVLPTLLALCGVEPPADALAGLHGDNLLEQLDEPGLEADFVFTFNHAALAVREVATGLKLVHPTDGHNRYRVEPQLFHLPSDPDERVNVYAERPDDVARLTAAVEDWRERHHTEGTWDQPMDPELRDALRDLGYTDVDIGR